MAAVTLTNVYKKQPSQTILDNISLTIDPGEFVAIVGPSGCGKSTLLRLVAGLDKVSSGQILINNICVNSIPAHLRDMAMVFQSYALYPHMTVFNNMAYGLKMRKVSASEIQSRVLKTAAMLQLTDFLQRFPQQLSGGQRQRVAMGRAIVRSPTVFLFDEPLSNLDAKLRTEMRYEIRKLHQQLQTTSLYVTHDHTEAMTMATKIVVLNQGRVEQVATPTELYRQPASLFVARFTGNYPINLLDGFIDRANQQIVLDIGLILPLTKLTENMACGDAVIVGVRPEDFFLEAKSNGVGVELEYIEEMGADTLIHVVDAVKKIQVLVRSQSGFAVPSRLTLDCKSARAIIFSKHTGRRIGGLRE